MNTSRAEASSKWSRSSGIVPSGAMVPLGWNQPANVPQRTRCRSLAGQGGSRPARTVSSAGCSTPSRSLTWSVGPRSSGSRGSSRDLGPAERQPLLLAKLEMLNPGGSVKDRIGLPMIEAAERAGLLKPGGTIIEPTRGNTGHGLAIAAALKGYRCIFVMADKQSAEKQQLLRAYGAEVVLCPTNVAARIARELLLGGGPARPRHPGRVQARPVLEPGEPGGPRADDRSGALGPDRRAGSPISSRASGPAARSPARPAPQGRNPAIQVIGADPEGSVLSGDTARPYLTEGVGEDFLPGTYDPTVVDRWVRVSDRDAFAMARRLTREEGILSGGSCGTAMVAAREVVRELAGTDADTGCGRATPDLRDRGLVERSAGAGAGFADEQYLEAGAEIAPDAVALHERAGVIARVAPPDASEAALLRPGTLVMGLLVPFWA